LQKIGILDLSLIKLLQNQQGCNFLPHSVEQGIKMNNCCGTRTKLGTGSSFLQWTDSKDQLRTQLEKVIKREMPPTKVFSNQHQQIANI